MPGWGQVNSAKVAENMDTIENVVLLQTIASVEFTSDVRPELSLWKVDL